MGIVVNININHCLLKQCKVLTGQLKMNGGSTSLTGHSMFERKISMSLAYRHVVILSNIKMLSLDIATKLDKQKDINTCIFL